MDHRESCTANLGLTYNLGSESDNYNNLTAGWQINQYTQTLCQCTLTSLESELTVIRS